MRLNAQSPGQALNVLDTELRDTELPRPLLHADVVAKQPPAEFPHAQLHVAPGKGCEVDLEGQEESEEAGGEGEYIGWWAFRFHVLVLE